MRSSVRVPFSEPTEIDRHDCPETDTSVGSVLTEIVTGQLWTTNAAAELAALVGCSTRTIERYFASGDYSGDAIAAIVSEILRRHAMRNVRVSARR